MPGARTCPTKPTSHLIELVVAAQAVAIGARNVRDVLCGELKFHALRVLKPEQCMKVFRCVP